MSDLHVSAPGYFEQGHEAKRFADFCDIIPANQGPVGLWEVARVATIPVADQEAIMQDRCVRPLLHEMKRLRHKNATVVPEKVCLGNDDYWITADGSVGLLRSQLWAKNVLTDNGATSMIKNLYNNAGAAVAVMNQIAIDTNAGSTSLTTALTNGQAGVTSLPVASIPGPIASGVTVQLGYGTAQTQNVTLSAAASIGATSLTVTSFTANAAYAVGSAVVPVPSTSDNPSSLAGTSAYSGALAGGAFAFSGTGVGNRQVVVTYTFSTATTAGSYNEYWMCNANPVVANATSNHLIIVAQPINSTNSLAITFTEKM